MTHKKMPFLMATVLALIVAALCDCNGLAVVDSPISVEASVSSVNITGSPVDEDGFFLPGEFIVNIKNPSNGQVASKRFTNFEFSVTIQVPSFAEENDTLVVNITDLSGDILYGSATVQLIDMDSNSEYVVLVTVNNPPPNYSIFFLIAFIVIMGAIIGSYAMFTRWFIGKLVIRRANEIRLEQWKKQGGGGNLNP